jgi:hypothetical protein
VENWLKKKNKEFKPEGTHISFKEPLYTTRKMESRLFQTIKMLFYSIAVITFTTLLNLVRENQIIDGIEKTLHLLLCAPVGSGLGG